MSVASCDSGLPNCMDAAVLVANERFMSRVEKVAGPCENGEGNGLSCCDGGSGGGGED